MIDIKDISEEIKLSIEPQEGSIRRFELMKEDYVQPKFSLASPVYFEIGDSVEIEGEPFYITELMYPSFNTSNAGYDYELRFDSHYFRWKNHTLFYDRQGNKEPGWKLTRSPEAHLGIVVSNIRALGFKYKGLDYQAIVDSTVDTSAKLVEYDNTNIIDALTKIAEIWECEWWVDGDKIYLGKCEHGEPIDLEIGKEISSMTRSQSKETYANRIYAFGSTRNIPTNYRSNTGGGSVVEGVVTKRLMLPVGIDHIDVIEGLKDSEVVDRVVVFDKVYPRTTCTITSVETKEVAGDQEKGEPETYTVYRFRDSNFHFSSKYILPNKELRIVFQYGPLSGFDFGVTFNPDKASEDTEAGQVFEVPINQDYGQWLPADPLKPAVGSQFILYGFDTQFISDKLLGNAEQELLEEAQAFVKKLNVDPSTYNCVVNSYLASGYDERNGVLNPDLAINMKAGQKVNLINQAYFKNGRVSRVIGFEKKLDTPYDAPTYIIGESSAYSRIGELEEKIDNIQFKGNTYVNQGGGGSIYVIKKEDPTAASDENVFSSLRTLEEINQIRFSIDEMYLRKDINDTAHGIISFDHKVGSSIFMDGYDGKGWEIRETGGALFDSAQIRSDVYLGGRIGSPSFASGFTGWGWEIDTPTASGTVNNWTVRKSAKFYEMICSQVYGLNSSFMVSDWNKIESVTPLGSNRYRCRINDMEGEMFVNLRNGDIVRTQKRDGWNIRYFASVVENVSSETFDLKVIEGEDSPQVGDYAQRIGSKTDKNRQGLIYFTSSDDYAPYIDILDGVTDAQFRQDNTKVRIGNLRGIRINGQPLDMHGIYINGGVFQHSTYYMADGNTIEQQFSIMDGKLRSEIEGVRSDISGEKGNILRNSSFTSDLNYWTTTGNVHFIPVMGGFMWLPSAFYVDKEAISDIYRDGGRNVLRIRNNSLTQINGVLNLPIHSEASEDGKYTYSFSFHYKVLRAGTLKVGVKGSELYTSQSLPVSEDYELLFHEGMWNEQGNFEISFTGEILIYGATLRNDSSADAFIYMKTGIEQSEEKIRLWATKELKDTEGRITTKYDSELKITAEEISQRVTRQEFNKETGKLHEEYDGELSVMSNRINQRVTYSEFDSETSNLRRSLESSITTEAGRITAVSKEVDAVKKTITSAGWITTTTGNTLWAKKDMENGKTLISAINQTAEAVSIDASKINLNGLVTANKSFKILADGSMQCTGGTVGGFTIKQYSIESGGLSLTGGQLHLDRNRGVEVIIGGVSASAGANYAGIFINDDQSGGTSSNGSVLTLKTGYSNYSNVEQCWIDCSHTSGWGSSFKVSSRYFGDTNQMQRTYINVGKLMTEEHAKRLANNQQAFKQVGYDDTTGNLFFFF